MKRIVVIGAGPAGIEAALTLANHGENVTIVTDRQVGDWKLSSTAYWLKLIGKSDEGISIKNVKKDVEQLNESWSNSITALLEEQKVNIVIGKASIISPNEMIVRNDIHEQRLSADYFILSVGSRPFFPETMLPDGKQIFSYDTINDIHNIPKSIVVVGDGPIGFEAVHIFSKLGSSVKWLVPPNGPSSLLFDEEVDRYLLSLYKEKGVNYFPGDYVSSVEKKGDHIIAYRGNGEVFKARMAFLTLGFRSNLDTLQLQNADLTLDEYGMLDLNEYGQTKHRHIYVVGDAEKTISAVYSAARARVAALHLIGKEVTPVNIQKLPLSFHDYPEVSQVGNLDDSLNYKMIRYDKRNFNSFLTKEREGFIKLAWNDKKVLVGALAVGYLAKDLISQLALLINLKIPINELSTHFSAHPSMSEFVINELHSLIDQT